MLSGPISYTQAEFFCSGNESGKPLRDTCDEATALLEA